MRCCCTVFMQTGLAATGLRGGFTPARVRFVFAAARRCGGWRRTQSSLPTRQLDIASAPSPHGDVELTGFQGWLARRPLTGFLVIVRCLSWLLFLYQFLPPMVSFRCQSAVEVS